MGKRSRRWELTQNMAAFIGWVYSHTQESFARFKSWKSERKSSKMATRGDAVGRGRRFALALLIDFSGPAQTGAALSLWCRLTDIKLVLLNQ